MQPHLQGRSAAIGELQSEDAIARPDLQDVSDGEGAPGLWTPLPAGRDVHIQAHAQCRAQPEPGTNTRPTVHRPPSVTSWQRNPVHPQRKSAGG